ncbi:MAG: M23 family metallopeptidase [Dermatophilaceae bacterium]
MTRPTGSDGATSVALRYPFHGQWMALNSPARRVPSHGTHLFGTTYAIDFVGVDESGRTARWGWRAALASEPPASFAGFDRPILAPLAGRVVRVHDGELDHGSRRSLPVGIPYALTQARRVRQGAAAIAGNHVVVSAGEGGPFVLVAHLRRGSIRVRVGEVIEVGQILGTCGNSGNSTQPHVHVQATDAIPGASARGLPIAFRARDGALELPAEKAIVTA